MSAVEQHDGRAAPQAPHLRRGGATPVGGSGAAQTTIRRHIDLVQSRSAADLAVAEADRSGRIVAELTGVLSRPKP
jgi:hypothetical protein